MKIQLSKIIWAIRAQYYRIYGLKVGWLSYIGKPIFVEGLSGVTFGSKVRVFPGARIETHKGGSITFEDNVSVGQNLHITSGFENLAVGSGTVILGSVMITNIDHEYKNISTSVSQQPIKPSKTNIGRNCFIGYGASIQAGTILSDNTIVGTNSVVRGHYPAGVVLAGAPAQMIKKYNYETKTWEKTVEK